MLLKTRALVQASSGGGKSYLLRYVLERTAGRVPHLVVDPEGEFISLRERYPYVVVGEGGNVAARPETAGPRAWALVEAGASAVLDLYALRLGERREFVRGFLEGLLALPRSLWRPALVVIDEAHRFAPERGGGEAGSLDAVVTLCTQGRKRGLGAVLATQRLSKLHKDVAAELLNVFVGRTGLDVDVRRSDDALGLDRGGWAELKVLRPGDFFAVGPAVGSDGVAGVRAGAVETRHPEPGGLEVSAGSVPPPPEELRATLDALAALEPEAEPDATPNAPSSGAGENRALERAWRAEARATEAEGEATRLRQRLGEALEAAETLRTLLLDSDTGEGAGGAQEATEEPQAANAPPERLGPARREGQMPARQAEGVEGVMPAHRKILSALRLASGRFSGHLAAMKRAGWVAYPGGRLALTEAGLALVPAPEASSTAEALHAAWLAKLSEPQGRLLRALLDAHPKAMKKDALAETTGYSAGSGSFSSHLAALRALGAVEYPAPGEARASALLFSGDRV